LGCRETACLARKSWIDDEVSLRKALGQKYSNSDDTSKCSNLGSVTPQDQYELQFDDAQQRYLSLLAKRAPITLCMYNQNSC
jgi:hypothetical protein